MKMQDASNEVGHWMIEESLRLRSIDPKKFRALEEEVARKFDKLIDDSRQLAIKNAIDHRERNRKLIARVEAADHRLSELALQGFLGEPIEDSIANALFLSDPWRVWPFGCYCFFFWPVPFISTESTPANAPDRVTEGPGKDQVRLKADAKSTTGSSNTVISKTRFTFSFQPWESSVYCIRPRVTGAGYWIATAWSSECVGGILGSSHVQVRVRVRVDQLSSTVQEVEHPVLDYNTSTMGNGDGDIEYVSYRDGGLHMAAYLEGGHEAVVFVECEARADVTNAGRALVEMMGNETVFGFVVEGVWVARRRCYWPHPIIPKLLELKKKVAFESPGPE